MALKAVLEFLEEHNRPYSALDIQNNLKRDEFGKSAVQKALDSLVENGQVGEKVYGKQKVYFITQDTTVSAKAISEEILALDRQINEVSLNIRETTQKIKKHTAECDQVKRKLTLAELCEKKLAGETQLRNLKDALKKFEGVDPVTSEVKEKIQSNYDKYLGIYKKRKRMCLDVLDAILENYPKTKKQLYEDVGLVTDEEAGFSLK